MNLTLYSIETRLQELVDLRDQLGAEGDSEAIEAVDHEIAGYLTREAAKINSYAAMIRQRCDSAALCKARAAELAARAKAFEADVQRLKDNALRVMESFGVTKLETPETTLRVQGNGGLQPLEITIPSSELPAEFQLKSITLNMKTWDEVGLWLGKYNGGLDLWHKILGVLESQQPQINTHFVREALKRGESVPGAKLLERGKHLRVE